MTRPKRKSEKRQAAWEHGPMKAGAEPRISQEMRWSDADKESVKFVQYYKGQKIIPEEEWDEFLRVCKSTLPTTFRITGSREIAPFLHSMIQTTFVPYLSNITHDNVLLSPPKPLPWYPNEWAWQLNIAKIHIRKNEAFRKFQNFLVYETDAGNISRQEAVSMIPPLLLDVRPEHHVLDMCAAPGSKSVQLLEAIHALPTTSDPIATATATATPSTSSIPSRLPAGLLIANDSDAKRCHMLVHQSLHRIPAAGMAVTNHDATQLPGLRIPNPAYPADRAHVGVTAGEGEGEGEKDKEEGGGPPLHLLPKKYMPLLFDRILADVPCSGDGTMRKNMAIWKDWSPGNGAGLHSLQLRILLRGLVLLKPGGRMVYSTCSLNPIENEAVVSAALEATPGLQLLDVSDMLPGLIRRPGLTTWNVLSNDMEDAKRPTSDEPPQPAKNPQKKIWASTLWPNGKEEERGLERCLRIYPHLQDTGGFFVAVLKKAEEESDVKATGEAIKRAADVPTSPSTTEPSAKRSKADTEEEEVNGTKKENEEKNLTVEGKVEEAIVPDEVDAVMATLPAEVGGAPSKKGKGGDFKEEPFIYLEPEDEQVKLCLEFFDLSPDFPVRSLLVRNASGAALRSIYFTSPIVRSLLLSNTYTRMRLISCGVKFFSRQDSSKDGVYRCRWRVMSDGLEILRPYMGPKRLIQANLETLKAMMMEMNVGIDKIPEVAFKERLAEMEMGSCVVEVVTKGQDSTHEQKMMFPMWRAPNSVTLMVEKLEKSALSLRLFGEDITPHAPKLKEQKAIDARDARNAKKTTKKGSEAVTDDAAEVVAAEDLTQEEADALMDRAEKITTTESMSSEPV